MELYVIFFRPYYVSRYRYRYRLTSNFRYRYRYWYRLNQSSGIGIGIGIGWIKFQVTVSVSVSVEIKVQVSVSVEILVSVHLYFTPLCWNDHTWFFFLIHNSVNFHRPHPRQLLSSFSLNSPLEKKILKRKLFIFYKNI